MIRKTSKGEKNENYSNRLELMKRIDKQTKERIIKIYYSPKLLNDKQKKTSYSCKNRNLHKNNSHNSENFQEEDIEGFPLRMKFKESVKKLTFLSVW
jgi:hypothetical protein